MELAISRFSYVSTTVCNVTLLHVLYTRPYIRPSLSHWPCGLRCRPVAARLLRLWVEIPRGAWMSVCCECCVLSGRGLWCLRRANYSSREILPTVVRRWVCSRNLVNGGCWVRIKKYCAGFLLRVPHFLLRVPHFLLRVPHFF